MLARVPPRPFSLDPLIQEAKRRARQRRVLIAVGIALVAGASAGAVLAAGSPGGSGSGGGGLGPGGGGEASGSGSLASVQASFSGDPTHAPVTAASIAAAHRDGVRMLRLFVPPPGARRVAYEPAFYRPQAERVLGRNRWGLGPALSDRFARFAYWRVPASVAAVARFERTHHPGYSLTDPGYYGSTKTKTPRHGASNITFAPIGSLVFDRHMQVWILRLASHQTAIRVAVSNSPWSPRSFRAALKSLQIVPIGTREAPVAGKSFTGVKIIDVNPRIAPLKRVVCGGTLGDRPLAADLRAFVTTPPPGWAAGLARAEAITKVEAVACTWQIPADAAGERLRLGSGHGDSARAAAYTARTPEMNAGGVSSPEYSWVVRP
jgi:hypothetical protein